MWFSYNLYLYSYMDNYHLTVIKNSLNQQRMRAKVTALSQQIQDFSTPKPLVIDDLRRVIN